MKRYLALLLSMFLLVSLLAACGGNEDSSSDPLAGESTLPSATVPTTLPTDPSMSVTDPVVSDNPSVYTDITTIPTQIPSQSVVTDIITTPTQTIATEPTTTTTTKLPDTSVPSSTTTVTGAPIATQAPVLTQTPGVRPTTLPSATAPTTVQPVVTTPPAVAPTTTTTAQITTAPSTAYQDAVAPLANSKYLLEKGKKLNVGYIGGSVTGGYGASDSSKTSWRALTTAWLKKTYPNANITEINAARGGTGSYFAKHRLQNELLQYKPDLVYIEFVINDKLEGNSLAQSQDNMETIVRKCYEVNPNMDIVFVYLTTVSIGTAPTNQWILAFNNIANHYGIETIHGGVAMGNSGKPLKSLFMDDGTHPIDEGYAVIAQEVIKRTQEILDKAGNPTSIVKHIVPTAINSNLSLNTQIHLVSELKAQNPSLGTGSSGFTGDTLDCIEMKPGETFTFKFTGTSVGVYWMSYDRTEYKVTCTLDGNKVTQRLARFNSNGHAVPLFEGLENGEHTLTFTYTGTAKLQLPMVFTAK